MQKGCRAAVNTKKSMVDDGREFTHVKIGTPGVTTNGLSILIVFQEA
jgi:hypothetical protein